MSAVVSPKNGSNVVNFKSSSRRNFLQYLAKLSAVESEVIASIPNQTDAEILETRSQAGVLGRSAWKIECACDSQVWQRAEDKRKSLNKTTDCESIKKVLSDHSSAVGCTPQTLYNNRRVFELIQEVQIKSGFNLDALDTKGFFLEALKDKDPITAIKLINEEKGKNAKLRVSDAGRLLEENNSTKTVVAKNTLISVRTEKGNLTEREIEIDHLNRARKLIIKQILPDCPSDRIRSDIWDEALSAIASELGEADDDDIKDALITSWDSGKHREDEIAEHTGVLLETVNRLMKQMSSLSHNGVSFILVPREGEFKTWHKVGEPLPIELRGGAKTKYVEPKDEDDEDW